MIVGERSQRVGVWKVFRGVSEELRLIVLGARKYLQIEIMYTFAEIVSPGLILPSRETAI